MRAEDQAREDRIRILHQELRYTPGIYTLPHHSRVIDFICMKVENRSREQVKRMERDKGLA